MRIRSERSPLAQVEEPTRLTKREKMIGFCMLAVYLAMIAITVATFPYLGSEPTQNVVERGHDSF